MEESTFLYLETCMDIRKTSLWCSIKWGWSWEWGRKVKEKARLT